MPTRVELRIGDEAVRVVAVVLLPLRQRLLRRAVAGEVVEEEARVPHLLYGHVDAAENYSVGRWCADAAQAIREAGGNRQLAADILQISYKSLLARLKELGITD